MIDLYESENKKNKFLKTWFPFLYDINSIFYFVLILIGTAFLFYGLILVSNGFMTPFSGDYVMQYVPFAYNYWDDWHYFFSTGIFPYWDSNIFLGADTITSDGYYIMFSPFFIPLLFFPRSWVPVILSFISVLRIVLAGVFFRLYLKTFNIKEIYCRIGAIAYAFCGWMAFYQWFNNFLDILAFLPLILLGAEKVLREKKPWLLAASLGLLGIDNFFFFPATCILMAIYCVFRFFQRVKLNNVRDNVFIILLGLMSFALGVLFSMSVFLPGLITGLSDPKVSDLSYIGQLNQAIEVGDWGKFFSLLFFWEGTAYHSHTWHVYYPIIEMFFPVTTCRNLGILVVPGDVNYAGTLWVATPIMFFLLPAIIQGFKDKKVSVLIALILIIGALFTPALYFLLFGGAKAYTRWLIIYPPIVIAFTMKYLSDHRNDIKISTLFMGYIYLLAGILMMVSFTQTIIEEVQDEAYYADKTYYMAPFPLVVIIEVIYITVLFLVYCFIYKRKYFAKALTYVSCVEAICIGTFVALGHSWINLSTSANGNLYENDRLYKTVERINSSDDSYFRLYHKLIGSDWNNSTQNNYSAPSFFNTLYNYNTQRFKWWANLSGYDQSWSGYYPGKRPGLDSFLNMKYYVINNSDLRPGENYRPNVPLNYNLNEELSDDFHSVYAEDSGRLNIGYSYDSILTYKKDSDIYSGMGNGVNYNAISLANDETLMGSAILTEEDYATIDEGIKADFNEGIQYDLATMSPTLVTSGYNLEKNDYTYDFGENGEYSKEWTKLVYDEDNGGYEVLNDLYKVINSNHQAEHDEYTRHLVTLTKRYKSGFYTPEEYFSDPVNSFGYNNEGSIIYVQAPFEYEDRCDVYLLGKDGKLLTFDNHGDYLCNANWLQMRTYYTKEDVYAIVFYLRNGGKGEGFKTYMETGKSFSNRLNEMTKYPLENVQHVDANTFKFTTNYEKHRMICLNIAYETGWKVFSKDASGNEKELKTFLTDGGLLGFVSEVGDTSYTMIYRNEYAHIGDIVSRIAVIILVSTYVGYIYIDYNSKYKNYKRKYLGL